MHLKIPYKRVPTSLYLPVVDSNSDRVHQCDMPEQPGTLHLDRGACYSRG